MCGYVAPMEDHLKDPGVDGIIILKNILDRWNGGHGLDRSGSDTDRWWALVNVYCTFGFLIMREIY